MKAVFFFIDESREPCTAKTSAWTISSSAAVAPILGGRTLLAVPRSNVELTKLSYILLAFVDLMEHIDARFLALSMAK
jgi:hypothetical protein